MRTGVWGVITWLGAVSAAERGPDNLDAVTLPRELWEKVLARGKTVLEGYDEFCSAVYTTAREAEVPDKTEVPEADKVKSDEMEILFAGLGNECSRFAENMNNLRKGLSAYLYVDVKRGIKMAIVKREKLEGLMELCGKLAKNVDGVRQEFISTVDERLKRVYRLIQGHKLIDKIQGSIEDLSKAVSEALGVPTFISNKRVGEAQRGLGADLDFIHNALNVLGASFIKEGGLNDVLQHIVFDKNKFDAILQTVRDYLGKMELNASRQAYPFSDPVWDLLMHPVVLENKLMNLKKIFPDIGKTKVFKKLCTVFMAEYTVLVLTRKAQLSTSCSRRDTNNNASSTKEFSIIAERYGREVTYNMREEFSRKMQAVEGITGSVRDVLSFMFKALKNPEDTEIKNLCRFAILEFHHGLKLRD